MTAAVRAADEWWASRTDDQRVAYHRWLAGRAASTPPTVVGQLDAADLLPDLDLQETQP